MNVFLYIFVGFAFVWIFCVDIVYVFKSDVGPESYSSHYTQPVKLISFLLSGNSLHAVCYHFILIPQMPHLFP